MGKVVKGQGVTPRGDTIDFYRYVVYKLLFHSTKVKDLLMDSIAKLAQRFPKLKEIMPVFAVVAFPIYTWTTLVWLWKLPSWLLYLTPLEITGIFSYAMLASFLECLLVCGLILLLAACLPSHLFRDVFTVRGVWMAIGLALCVLGYGGWMLMRVIVSRNLPQVPIEIWSVISFFIVLVLVFLSTRFRVLSSFAIWFSEKTIVFLYIQIPISILSIVVVLVRNIF